MARPVSSGKIVAAAIDWCTATATTAESSENLWSVGERLIQESLLKGELTARWHGHGYDGWSVAGCSLGRRPDGVLLRLSGQKAGYHWCEAVSASDNVTRLDLAVDVECEPPVTSVAVDLYRDAGHGPSRNGRPPSRSIVRSSDGGATCYVGKRASEKMGRCYDKGVEQKSHQPGHWWRWELELKGDSAFHTAASLRQIDDYGRMLVATALGFFRERGGRPPAFEGPVAIINRCLQPTNAAKRIQWLARSVRPTVVSLIDALGHDRVLGALGLGRAIDNPVVRLLEPRNDACQIPQQAKSSKPRSQAS